MGNMRLPVINGNENEIDVEAASKLIEVRPDEDVPAWVFRFLQAFPSVTVTLSGMSDMEQLKANIHTYAGDFIAPMAISSVADDKQPECCIDCHSYSGQTLMTMFRHYNENSFCVNSFTLKSILGRTPLTIKEYLLEDFTAVKVKYGEKLKLLNTIVQILTTIAGQVY